MVFEGGSVFQVVSFVFPNYNTIFMCTFNHHDGRRAETDLKSCDVIAPLCKSVFYINAACDVHYNSQLKTFSDF